MSNDNQLTNEYKKQITNDLDNMMEHAQIILNKSLKSSPESLKVEYQDTIERIELLCGQLERVKDILF